MTTTTITSSSSSSSLYYLKSVVSSHCIACCCCHSNPFLCANVLECSGLSECLECVCVCWKEATFDPLILQTVFPAFSAKIFYCFSLLIYPCFKLSVTVLCCAIWQQQQQYHSLQLMFGLNTLNVNAEKCFSPLFGTDRNSLRETQCTNLLHISKLNVCVCFD